jgi:hypothetical protein
MSRKKNRQTRKAREQETAQTTGIAKAKRRSEPEFNPDYTYVIKDLKRIGALAGTFLVILVLLAFILN